MSLGDYFMQQADWRRRKADEYPDDGRNAQSAAALASLAEFVAGSEDERVQALRPFLFEGQILGGEGTARAVSRYGFGYAVSAAHHIDFLDELRVLALMDAFEFVGDAGDQYDPTGVLYPFEIAAALAHVSLPDGYWRRRGQGTVDGLRAEVEAYLGQGAEER